MTDINRREFFKLFRLGLLAAICTPIQFSKLISTPINNPLLPVVEEFPLELAILYGGEWSSFEECDPLEDLKKMRDRLLSS